jgi:hypothetical protein
MRLAAALVFALLSAPAFAQEAKERDHLAAPMGAPPPEGFYRGIPNAYDLLARLQPVEPMQIVEPCVLRTLPDMSREDLKLAEKAFNKCMREWEKQRGGRLYPYAVPVVPRGQ